MNVGALLRERACWIAGPAFEYGPDDTGYYKGYRAECASNRTHVVVRDFEAPAPSAARSRWELAIAVLGYARVLINGRPVPTAEYYGHWTRFDKLVYYDLLDVTDLIRPGGNTIAIELGNGFYNPAPLALFNKYNLRERLSEVGTPQVAAILLRDGACALATDGSWDLARGQLLFNNVYLGEVRDLTYRPRREGAATVHAAPGSRALEPSPVRPVAAARSIDPVSVLEVDEGVLVDFGEMVSGTIELTVDARAEDRIELVYAELEDHGTVNTDTNLAGLVGMRTPRGVLPGGPGAPLPALQRDLVVCQEGANSYRSVFTYHSFRYVLVRHARARCIGRVRAWFTHTRIDRTGYLSCGLGCYGDLFDAALRTKLNNIHDLWEDCSRERFGYGGDMVALMTSNLMLLDEEGLLDKTLGDFGRDQTPRGGLPETAPFIGVGSNGPAYGEGPLLWQLAYPYLAVLADRYYGRRDLIEREWRGLVRFGEYILSFDPAELSGHCLGDHGSILTERDFKTSTPDKGFLGWCAILWCLQCLCEAGRRIDRDTEMFGRAARELGDQIIGRFRNADGSFGDGTQSAAAFAGMLGLGDPGKQAALFARDYRDHDGTFTTGIFGTMLAFELLHRTGRDDICESWLLRREHPSLLAMLSSGSGALTERFAPNSSSANHAMFSSYAQWLMQALVGIRVADEAVGCDKVVIAPYFSPETDLVAGSYRTPRGRIRVSWHRGAHGRIEVSVEAPSAVMLDVSALEGRAGVGMEIRRL